MGPAAATPRRGRARFRTPGSEARASEATILRMVERVLLASPRGYCAGVERAVETVELALEHYGPPVYVRKQIVHNIHVVRDLEMRGAIFVDSEEEAPRGATIVYSAHGVAPSVNAASAGLGHNVIDATCPLVTKVHVQARRYAADGYTVILIGHAGHEEVVGTMGEAPEATVLVQDVAEAEALELPAGREGRLHHADHTVGRRDVRDHRRPPPALPRDPCAEEGGHLLRDLQPAVGGQGDARRGRPAARDRLAQLVELEPPGRRRPGRRRRVTPDRRRDGDRRGVAGRRHDRRRDIGRVRAGEARQPGLRLVSRARRRADRAVQDGERGRHLPPAGRAAPRARARRNAARSSRRATGRAASPDARARRETRRAAALRRRRSRPQPPRRRSRPRR